MALATVNDLATRLGRDLTEAEQAMATQVIEEVSDEILRIAGTAEPDPVPGYYRALCIAKVIVVGTNPNGLAAESKTLGAYSTSKTFQRSNDDGAFLTEREEQVIRRIAGNISGSSRPHALPHDVYVVEDA